MKKSVNFKERIWDQLCSAGAVLMSLFGMLLLLYLVAFLIRAIAPAAL